MKASEIIKALQEYCGNDINTDIDIDCLGEILQYSGVETAQELLEAMEE